MSISAFDRRGLLFAGAGLAFGTLLPSTRLWAQPAFSNDPFALGVAAGDPLPDGFVIWTRLAPKPLEEHGGMPTAAVAVRWEVAADEGFTKIVRAGDAIAPPELGHSVHVEVSGLQPGRRYWYRFHAGSAAVSMIGTAKTAPPPGSMPDRVRIGVAGCQHYEQGFYTAYRHLSEEPDIDLVFHYGDYIYEGAPGKGGKAHTLVREHVGPEPYSLDDYRLRYGLYKMDADLKAAHAAAAFVMSFDDHEVDNNWASDFDQDGTPAELFALRRAAAMQAWYEHMPVRRAQLPRAGALQMYRRLDYGRLFRMHVLDTRSHRDDQLCENREQHCVTSDSPSRTILGAQQERWLAEGLTRDPKWNFIAQQVLVMPFDSRHDGASEPEYGTDNWSGYRPARQRLVKAIADRKLTNVVIATGDAHQHFVGSVPLRDEAPDGPAVASEFLTSSISTLGDGSPRRPGQNDALKHNPNLLLLNNQRGYQLFDVTPGRWDVDVKVMDVVQKPGTPVRSLARFSVDPRKPGPQRA